MLLLGQAEGVFAALVVRCAVLSHRSLVLKGSASPNAAAPQGEHLCRTKVQLAVPATGTKRRTADRSFPASKIIRGSLRRHSVFKVQYYNAAARAANPSDGLRRSGAVSRFGGHDGVLSCGRKRECTPDRTHVLVFAWTDVCTCSHMSGCTNTNILARPLASKSESEHPHTHDCRHPFTDSCSRSCLHLFTHRFSPD